MGNGASIFLSADLSKSLSEKSIRTFQDFENECIARNLNAEQIYELLVNKYEELLDFDSLKKMDPKPTERADTANSTKSTSQKKPRSCMLPKSSWGAGAAAKKKLEKRSEVNAYYSKLNQKNRQPSKLAEGDSSRSLQTLQSSADYYDIRTISEETVSLNRVDSLELAGNEDDQTVCFITGRSDSIYCDVPISPRKNDAPPPAGEVFECKLCRKHFNTRARLDLHLRYSEVHRQTLLALKERFFDDANGLDNLAKKAINHFQESFKASHSYYVDGEFNLSKLRWKKAIGKVVSRFIARKYETFVSQLQHSQYNAHDSSSIANSVSLLHTDCKFFWRSKSRFLFHFYYHEPYDCIEIIPQLLPSMYVNASEPNSTSTTGMTKNPTAATTTCHTPPATNQQMKLDPMKISPRFYINRRMMTKILLQQKELAGLDSHEEELENSVSYSANGNSTKVTNTTSTKGTSTNAASAAAVAAATAAVALADNPEAITIPPPTVTDLEICKFLLSKLKVDNQLIDNQVLIEKSIYFDSNHMMKNHQLVTINTVIPIGLKPMNIEGLKLYDEWEIKTKLNEIQLSSKELNDAVNKADLISKSVKLMSPSSGMVSSLLQRLSPYYLSPAKNNFANKFNNVAI